MRRALIALLLLAIVGAAVWTLLRWNKRATDARDPWSAIPAQAAVIIEVPDPWAGWDRFTHTSLLWSTWETRPGARTLSTLLSRVAGAMEKDAALRQALHDAPVLIALARNGSQGTGFVAIGALHGDVAPAALGDLLGIPANEQTALKNGSIVPVTIEGASSSLYAALPSGLWLLADSRELLEEALLRSTSGDAMRSDTLFAKARATLDAGTDAHVLVNTTRASGLLSTAWQPAHVERLGLPAGWLALDVSALPEALLLSGLLVPEASDKTIGTLVAQGSGAWNIGRVLPANVVQWEVRNVSDASGFLGSNPATAEALFPWAYGSVGVATACDAAGHSARRWLVVGTEDTDAAREDLMASCMNAPCDTVDHRGVRITHFVQAHAWEQLLGRAAQLPQQPWWAILGQHVVMSDDIDAVRASIDTWNDGNSLAESKRAAAWFGEMSDEAALTWWCDLARGGTLLGEGLRVDSSLTSWLPLLHDLGGLSVQVSPALHGMAHVSIGLQYAPLDSAASSIPTSGNTLWACDVGAQVLRTPDIVVNHTNNTREVLVQDTLHRIHLISASGKELWMRVLDGPLLGAVHQVDRFQNGKLQMLCATAKTCYLIDRNGKDVAGFPVALKVPAAAPPAVFDYDGQRDYRVLIPLKDRTILNLGLDGVAVKGWAPRKSEAEAVEAVRHLRIRNKDHLLLIDSDGHLLLLDRKGNERERVKTRLPRVKEVHAVIPGTDLLATRVQWTDEDLVLHETTLAGKELRTTPAEGVHELYADVDGDGTDELVGVAADSVRVVRRNGDRYVQHTGALLYPQPRIHDLGAGRTVIGVFAPATGQAWLVASDGALLPGMPLDACSHFAVADLNLDGAPELVAATRAHTVVAYRTPSK